MSEGASSATLFRMKENSPPPPIPARDVVGDIPQTLMRRRVQFSVDCA